MGLRKLVNESPNASKYEISYIDIILDQSIALKESNNSAWKAKAKEAGQKIKAMYATNTTNADYYLIWAKYSWVIESKRESNIYKALEKAFYYKPNYSYAYIVKGDIYSGLAKDASSIEQSTDTTALTGGNSANTRHFLALTAKSAYEEALSAPGIDAIKKAYIFYWGYALDSGIPYMLCLGFRPLACLTIVLSGIGSIDTACWIKQ